MVPQRQAAPLFLGLIRRTLPGLFAATPFLPCPVRSAARGAHPTPAGDAPRTAAPLATRASQLLGRADNLGDYVRRGCRAAYVEVTLSGGVDARGHLRQDILIRRWGRGAAA